MALVDYQSLVDKLVRDDTGKIATADRDEALARAVARYSKDRPRVRVEDVVAPGGNLLDLPTAWQDDFSLLHSIEYPIGQFPPVYIDQENIGWYQSPTVLRVLLQTAITAGQSVRMTFTVRHQLDSGADTIRADDREPVCAYAGAILLDQLAAFFSGSSDRSTIQADNVDHGSRGAEFARRAGTLRARYFTELGIDPKRATPAGVVVDLDMSDSLGRDRLLHPARYR